jgi:exonuclease SbcC
VSAVIEEVKMRNFEGYREADLKFSAGLNLICGRNSVGKSSVLDALSFALFGEAPDVKPRLLVSRLPGAREIAVYIRFRSPKTGDVVEIFREGKLDPKGAYKTDSRRLVINRRDVTLESDEELRGKVSNLLGTSFRKFLNLVYVRQGKLTTVLQPDRDQMDSMLGITLLRELRDQFDETKDQLNKHDGQDVATAATNLEDLTIPNMESTLKRLGIDIPILQEEVNKLEEQVSKGESLELATLILRAREKRRNEEEQKTLRTKMDETTNQLGITKLGELQEKINSTRKQSEELEAKLKTINTNVTTLRNQWSTLNGKADAIKGEAQEHEELLASGTASCPTCGQSIKSEVMKNIIKQGLKEATALENKATDAKEKYQTANEELTEKQKQLNLLQFEVKTLEDRKRTLSTYALNLTAAEQKHEEIVDNIRTALSTLGLTIEADDAELEVKLASQLPLQPQELESKKNMLENKNSLLANKVEEADYAREKLAEAKALLTVLKSRMDEVNTARRLAEGFEQAIEDRRRFILKKIEYRALDYYKAMTDQHVYTAISINPETYEVSVHPKELTEPIPATRIGGGHQTIIALAVRLAILDGLNFRSLLILDEPTYGIDSSNLPQLESQLGEASRQLSQMILVTHHGICEEEASNIIEVTVGADGTSQAKPTA